MMCITNQYFLFITQLNTENNVNVIDSERTKNEKYSSDGKTRKTSKSNDETFQNEMQTLNHELQSMLIDDMVTAFYNRLIVMKKIQDRH